MDSLGSAIRVFSREQLADNKMSGRYHKVPASPVHQAEAALGLKRTKAGAGDKEHAYLVSRDNCERMLIVLFLVSG